MRIGEQSGNVGARPVTWLYRALAALLLSVSLLVPAAAYADNSPALTAAPPPAPAQQIAISLSQQSLTATQDGAVVVQTPITSGGPLHLHATGSVQRAGQAAQLDHAITLAGR